MYTEQGSCSRTTICQRQGSRFGSSCQAGFPKPFTLFNHRNIDWLLFFLINTLSHNKEIARGALTHFLSIVPLLQPPARCVCRGHASSRRRRTAQCPCTTLPSWSAWPPATPDPSSPGAEPTASPSTFTTPKCWETATLSSWTSSASTAGCTCAGPPLPARATTPSRQPTSLC